MIRETTSVPVTIQMLVFYLYDAYGAPIGFQYHEGEYGAGVWDIYWYEKNLQGDIVAVYNSAGTKLVSYVYDAFGNATVTYHNGGEQIGQIRNNPFRYRGYYYDIDLGLYYLQTRYYDPVIGRFISADAFEVITATPAGLTDKNLFAYCDNNPVMRADSGGDFWAPMLIGAGVGTIAGIAGQFISDLTTSLLNMEWTFSNWQTYAGAAVGGLVGGAILGTNGNVALANAASGLVTTAAGMSLEKATNTSDKTWIEIGLNSVFDGVVGYGLGKLPGVKGLTKGRNSMYAVYRSGLTKLRNNTASRMSTKVVAKGLASGFVGGIAMDIYYGIKQFVYPHMRDYFLRYQRQ